jgi:hypothetical protein
MTLNHLLGILKTKGIRHPSYIKKVVYTFPIEILSATRNAESRRDIHREPQRKTKTSLCYLFSAVLCVKNF